LLAQLNLSLQQSLTTESATSARAGAIGQALKGWTALARFRDHAGLAIDSNAPARA